MPPNNVRNFLLTTDFTLDKIIYLEPRTVVVPAHSNVNTTIPHGFLGFTPLVKGKWSTSSDFSVSYNISGGPYLSAGLLLAATVIDADATNVYLSTTNNTGSSITIYYNIWAFIPSNALASEIYTPTASSADKFVLNTDNNYSKLFKRGIISTAIGTHTYPVNHGLGYYPQIETWINIGGRISPIIFNDVTTYAPEFDVVRTVITDQNLDISVVDVLSTYEVHYRIYLDEA